MARPNKRKRVRESKSSSESANQDKITPPANDQSTSEVSAHLAAPNPAPSAFCDFEDFPPTPRETELLLRMGVAMLTTNWLFGDGLREYRALNEAFYAELRANGRRIPYTAEEMAETWDSFENLVPGRQPQRDR